MNNVRERDWEVHMIHQIHELVWGPWLLLLFLGTGIFFTLKSGFFQIRRLPYWWRPVSYTHLDVYKRQTVDLPFEDTRLMCPKGWHEVLTWIYGDYMTLPPKDQQVPSLSLIHIYQRVFSVRVLGGILCKER